MTVEAKLRITPQLDAAASALRSLAREIKGLETASTQADKSSSFRGMQDGLRGLSDLLQSARAQLLGFFGIQAGAQAVGAIARMSDEMTGLQARLRIATQGQQEFNQALSTARQLATQYQGPLNETAALYTRVLRAVQPLGGGLTEARVGTEALLASLKISGASAQEAGSAILQFSQALGAGVLRGEEFNAINEAAPRLLDALAAGMVKPRSELKALAEQGQLTTSVVIKALQAQLPTLQAEAARIPATISGSVQQVRDALTQFVGAEAQGAVRIMIDLLKLLADNINPVAGALSLLAGAALFAAVGRLAGAITGVVLAGGSVATVLQGLLALIGGPVGLTVALIAAAGAWIGLSNAKQRAEKEMRSKERIEWDRQAVLAQIEDLKKGKGTTSMRYMSDLREARLTLDKLDRELAAAQEAEDNAAQSARENRRLQSAASLRDPAAIKAFEQSYAVRSDIVKKFADERAAYLAAKDQDIAAASARNDQVAVAKLSKERAAYLAQQRSEEADKLKAFDNKNALTRIAQAKTLYQMDGDLLADATQRAIKINAERWDQGLIDLQAYLAEKDRLENQALDLEITRLRAQRAEELRVLAANRSVLGRAGADANARSAAQEAVAEGERRIAQLDADLVKKERDRLDNARALTLEAKNLTRELQQQALTMTEEIAKANGTDTLEAIRARILAQREQARTKFVGGGGSAALFDANTEVAVRQGQLQLLQQQLQQARTNLSQAEEAVTIAQNAGQITAEEAERRILDLRRQQLPVLQAIAQQLQGMAVSPAEQSQARAAELENKRLADTRTELEKSLQSTAKSGLGTLFTDIVSGARTAGGALRNMLGNFAQQMLNLIGQRLGARLFESFGLGKVVDTVASTAMAAFGFHEGGVVAPGGQTFTRSINLSPLALALAPRYHSGGIVGLQPNEQVAVLENGEEVLTANDPRHASNYRGGGMQVSTSITINGASGDRQSQNAAAQDLDRAMTAAIDAWAVKQSRPGGILAGRG